MRTNLVEARGQILNLEFAMIMRRGDDKCWPSENSSLSKTREGWDDRRTGRGVGALGVRVGAMRADGASLTPKKTLSSRPRPL